MIMGHKWQLNGVDDNLPNIVLNNEVIKRVDKTKYLGINIYESLNWKEQYKTIKNKRKWGLSSLRKLKYILPQRNLTKSTKLFLKAIFAMVTLLGVILQHQAIPAAVTTDKGKEANSRRQV